MSDSLTLSLIICTKDRKAVLRQTLATVFQQTHRPDEILIVDDGALDRAAIVGLVEQQGLSCHYLRKATPGLAASRNLGVQQAQGDIILFLDDDVLLDPEYIAAIMQIFGDDPQGEIGGVTGTLQVDYAAGVRPFLRLFGLDGVTPGAILPSGSGILVRQGEIRQTMPVQWLSGCNMAYRREVFTQFHFDQRLGAYGWGEDRDFSYRVGQHYPLMATPSAQLVHLKATGGRINSRYMGFMETNYLYRFFAKNMPKRPHNWVALSWALLGIMLKNGLLSLRAQQRHTMVAQLRGNLEGIYAIFTGKDFRS